MKEPVLSSEGVIDMGKIRHKEALNASKITGVPEENLVFLGYPDFGTLHIFAEHWDESGPYKSILTRVEKVPYDFALHPSAPYKGEEILSDIKEIIENFKPTKIFVTHPADHHPDHQSYYLFMKVALWDLEESVKAEVYPYPVHYSKWPEPEGYFPDMPLTVPEPLVKKADWEISPLSKEELDIKEKALKEHKTQFEAAEKKLTSFLRSNELFGEMPLLSLTSEETEVVKEKRVKIPEEILEEENIDFIGMEKQTIKIEDDRLVIFVDLTTPLAEASEYSVYLFGYKKDRNFSVMPKLHIKAGVTDCELYDQNEKLSKDLFKVRRDNDKLTFYIPLEALGKPEKIIMGTKLYMSEFLVDWSPWRVLVF